MLKQQDDYDVAVLGGGLAGLTMALHVRKETPGARVIVLEKNRHPVPEAAFKVGESTVEIAANYFGKVLDLEDHIVKEQLPKLGLRFFFGYGDNSQIERRLELGGTSYPTTPSYQLDRGRFENYLGERCLQQGIDFVDEARVEDVAVNRGRKPHQVVYRANGSRRSIQTRWVVDASGRAGLLKRQLSLAKPSPHKANAVWFRVGEQIKIDDWSSDEKWQRGYEGKIARWYSTNHFMGKGYWVWLIPLASGSTSVGIVADENVHPLTTFNSIDKSLIWLDQYEPQCAQEIRKRLDEVQDFLAVKHYSMECQQVFSKARWGITGEAGFFLDPFYSPGSDFIAVANTFLGDLIQRDLAGKSIRFRSMLYGKIFKSFFHGTAQVYRDQYPVFGNQQVMPVKLVWDYTVYWSVTAFIMLHGRACDQFMYPRHMFKLARLRKLNGFMQQFFRMWNDRCPGQEVSGMIDVSHVPLIWDTNKSLSETLDRRGFSQRFADNVAQLESLFWEIIDRADLDVKVPLKRRTSSGASLKTIADVFRITTPGTRAEGERVHKQAPVSGDR